LCETRGGFFSTVLMSVMSLSWQIVEIYEQKHRVQSMVQQKWRLKLNLT